MSHAVSRAMLLASIAMLAVAPAVAAQERSSTVELTVSTVLATRARTNPDPSLQSLARLLEKAFADYSGFELLSVTRMSVPLGQQAQVPLPNRATLNLSYKGMEEAFIRLDLSIPPRLSTSVRVSDGGTFFQAGMAHGKGILVLAIKARSLS